MAKHGLLKPPQPLRSPLSLLTCLSAANSSFTSHHTSSIFSLLILYLLQRDLIRCSEAISRSIHLEISLGLCSVPTHFDGIRQPPDALSAITNRFDGWGIDDSFNVDLLFETLLSLPDYSLGIYS
jgi:hypothetical protein